MIQRSKLTELIGQASKPYNK